MSRRHPARVLLIEGEKWDNMRMEILLEKLARIGVDSDSIAAIRAENDKEAALLLIALFDDRHEYVG